MSMGSYNPHFLYRQENPTSNARAMTLLQEMKNQAFEKAGQAVDEWGQSRQRGKVSKLLNSEEYQKIKDPEEALAKVLRVTKGRNLGKTFQEDLRTSYRSKEHERVNDWANERSMQSQRNQIALENLRQRNRKEIGLLSGEIPTNQANQARLAYMQAIKKAKDPKERNDLIAEALLNGTFKKDDRIALDKVGLLGLPSNGRSNEKGNAPKWGNTKLYRSQTPKVRNFIESKYGRYVTEGKDGYYFKGRKLNDFLLDELLKKGR